MKYELFGMGNPLMDFLLESSEEEIEKLQLVKGNFNLVDAERLQQIEEMIAHRDKSIVPGGSVANTMAVFAQLGGQGIYCGKVGDDTVATEYTQAMQMLGIATHLPRSNAMTGRVLSFVTPDSDRTMAVHLGAAVGLACEDIDLTELAESNMLYLAGYVLEDECLRKAALHALSFAKSRGIRIAIDCADPGIVSRCGETLRSIIQEYANIVFANEAEAVELMGATNAGDALEKLSQFADTAVVKIGKQGSLIRHDGETHRIEAFPVTAVDTTGAGDSFAGAFLYAISKGYDADTAGRLGSFIAAKVVARVGARLVVCPDVSHIIAPAD